MTTGSETIDDMLRCARLHLYATLRFPAPAGRVERGLRVQQMVDRVDDHLHVALRLHETAHHAEWTDRFALTPEEAGDDRVVRPLAGFERIRMGGVEREPMAAVL